MGAHHGISSLTFDHTRSKLLVNVLNDAIKIVDVHAPKAEPIVQCGGHLASSFYGNDLLIEQPVAWNLTTHYLIIICSCW